MRECLWVNASEFLSHNSVKYTMYICWIYIFLLIGTVCLYLCSVSDDWLNVLSSDCVPNTVNHHFWIHQRHACKVYIFYLSWNSFRGVYFVWDWIYSRFQFFNVAFSLYVTHHSPCGSPNYACASALEFKICYKWLSKWSICVTHFPCQTSLAIFLLWNTSACYYSSSEFDLYKIILSMSALLMKAGPAKMMKDNLFVLSK